MYVSSTMIISGFFISNISKIISINKKMKYFGWLGFIHMVIKNGMFTSQNWNIRCWSLLSIQCPPLIGSRIIESVACCNQVLLTRLYLNSAQKMSVNWIIRLVLSLLCWPRMILLSGRHCTNKVCFSFLRRDPGRSLFKDVYKNKADILSF